MGIQTATTAQLENAQGTIIAKALYTMEHSMPVINLIKKYTLTKGNKMVTVPKVGQATFTDLVDGQDMVDTQDIGMTTVDLTAGEVGAKMILTDKLVRQENEDVFTICGKQLGDGLGRKKDTDGIALFSALNGGTVLGADNKYLKMANLQGCAAWAKANKLPLPISFVHHPNAVAYLASQAATAATTYPIPRGLSEDLLRDFYSGIKSNDVAVFEDGNIEVITGYDSGYGAIFAQLAMAYLESVGFNSERERDASLRATELNVTADYGLFEVVDGWGAGCQYEIGAIATNA